MRSLLNAKTLPLFAAAQTTGYGSGWWLSEWLWQPGNDATDVIVFQAFAVNFVVLFCGFFQASRRKAVGDA